MSEVDFTLWVGNLNSKITEELLWELFLQAGPLESVKIASDKEGNKKNFAFVKFSHVQSVPYSIQLMNGIRMHGSSLRLQTRPGSCHEENGNQQGRGGFQRSTSTPDMSRRPNEWGGGTPPNPYGSMGPPSFSTPLSGGSYYGSDRGDRDRGRERNRDRGSRFDDGHRNSPPSRAGSHSRDDYRDRSYDRGGDRNERNHYRSQSEDRRRDRDRDSRGMPEFPPQQFDYDQSRENVLRAQKIAAQTNGRQQGGSGARGGPWALAHAQSANMNNSRDMQPRYRGGRY